MPTPNATFPFYAQAAYGDNFDRGSENPITGPWKAFTGLTSMRVVSNVLAPSTTLYTGAYLNQDFDDCELTIAVNPHVADHATYLKARLSASADPLPDGTGQNGYQATHSELNNLEFIIYKIVNGVTTSLGSAFGGALASGDRLLFGCYGSTLEAWDRISGTWTRRLQIVDTTFKRGKVGMVLGPEATDVARYDNLLVGGVDLSAVAGTPSPDNSRLIARRDYP